MNYLCRKCGSEVSEDALFCSKCGAKVTALRCPKCGKRLPEDSVFCTFCGTKIIVESPSKQKPTPQLEKQFQPNVQLAQDAIQPKASKKGGIKNPKWFDEGRLNILGKGVEVEDVTAAKPGGCEYIPTVYA